jgi:hypothetical protein
MGPRMKQLMIYGTAGVGLIGGGWTLLAQMQGGGQFMQGGSMQGAFPAGNSRADQPSQAGGAADAAGNTPAGTSAGAITPAPSAFALPSEGPLSVSEIHGGQGKIKPYHPNQPATFASDATAQASGLMQITDPSALGSFLTQQPRISAQLNNSMAVQVQDSTGVSYSVTGGQLQGLLQLMASPGSGYSGTIDLSSLPADTAQRLRESGALSPLPQQQESSKSQGDSDGQGPAAGAPVSQDGNQSGSPGGGLPQQAQGDGAVED